MKWRQPLFAQAVAGMLAVLCPMGADGHEWPDADQRLARSLDSLDKDVRAAAVEGLPTLGKAEATPLLLHALGDADTEIRLLAAKGAEEMGLTLPETALASWFTLPDARIRAAALRLVAAPDLTADTALLTRAMSDEDDRVRTAAATAAGRARTPAVLGQLLQMEAEGPDVRRAVVSALAEFSPDPRAIGALAARANDPSVALRARVVRGLSRHATSVAEQTLVVLATSDPAPSIRVLAIEGLGKIGAKSSLPTLARATRDRSRRIALAAVAALGQIAADEAVVALLAQFGGPLNAAGEENEPSAVRLALQAHGVRAIGPLLQALEDADSSRVEGAALCLGAMQAHGAFEPLTAAFRRGTLREPALLEVLGGLGDERGIRYALEALIERPMRTRALARHALFKLLASFAPYGPAAGPISAALTQAHPSAEERNELTALLALTRTQ